MRPHLVIDGVTYKLSLLPSGVVRGGTLSVIGNGVVVDPWHLVEEIAKIGQQGVSITPEKLRVADNATLILPLHRELDHFRETSNTVLKIGTTKRGIGPAYEDKVGRRAIRVVDLADAEMLDAKIGRLLAHHNALRRGLGIEEVDGAALKAELLAIAPKILPFADTVWSLLDEARRAGKRILFEGAQGALLDVDHGTYPYVTSSNIVAAQAATGSGLGPSAIGYVLGIVKAYTTRVGRRPLPHRTVRRDRRADRRARPGVRRRHGGKRRCGWFDAALWSARRCGPRGSTVSRSQARHPRRLRHDPDLHRLPPRWPRDRPLARKPGGSGPGGADLRGVRGVERDDGGWALWADLPAQAIKYVRRIEELIGAPVALLSTSPERDDTILMHNPFEADGR